MYVFDRGHGEKSVVIPALFPASGFALQYCVLIASGVLHVNRMLIR